MRKVEDVKAEISLGCSGHEIVEFRILRRGSRAEIKIMTHDIRRADFGLAGICSDRLPWNKALNGKGGQESSLMVKDYLLQGEEQSIATSRKSGKNIRTINKEFLAKLKCKKERHCLNMQK